MILRLLQGCLLTELTFIFCIDYDNHPNGETITFRDSDDNPQSRVIDLSKDGGQLLQNGIHM